MYSEVDNMNHHEMNRSTQYFADVCNFIENLEPWAEVDAELFDESLELILGIFS